MLLIMKLEQIKGKDLAKNMLFLQYHNSYVLCESSDCTQEMPLLHHISSISRLSQKGLIKEQLSSSLGGASGTDRTTPEWTKGT